MTCPNCGENNREGSHICWNCGKSITMRTLKEEELSPLTGMRWHKFNIWVYLNVSAALNIASAVILLFVSPATLLGLEDWGMKKVLAQAPFVRGWDFILAAGCIALAVLEFHARTRLRDRKKTGVILLYIAFGLSLALDLATILIYHYLTKDIGSQHRYFLEAIIRTQINIVPLAVFFIINLIYYHNRKQLFR